MPEQSTHIVSTKCSMNHLYFAQAVKDYSKLVTRNKFNTHRVKFKVPQCYFLRNFVDKFLYFKMYTPVFNCETSIKSPLCFLTLSFNTLFISYT